MEYSCTYVPYHETGYCPRLVTDYLDENADITPFYRFRPGKQGFRDAIAGRDQHPVNRRVLVDVLRRQYAHTATTDEVHDHIEALLDENTYTVCTAHQPNLMTGYLYFIYKILHAIKLARWLKAQFPGKNFVPVFYMGSEDNDLDELGTFRFRGDKYVWDGNGQAGAVGRMDTAGLAELVKQLTGFFGPPGKNCDELKQMILNAYLGHKTIGEATHHLVNELFGTYGLVVLNPDDRDLKRLYVPVMADELLHQSAFPIINQQIAKLENRYKVQAQPRPINLFYLADQVRERIERHGERWKVVDTNISWTREELLAELNEYPERFSPNVMLRGLFQEMILPDVAFIGGGAEVSYWMQLEPLFTHYRALFPAIVLRQSVMWIRKSESRLMRQTGFNARDLFAPLHGLERKYLEKNGDLEWQTVAESAALTELLGKVKQKAVHVDQTLAAATDSILHRMQQAMGKLEQKMLRAEKRNMSVAMERIARLKAGTFPGGKLQERTENYMEYYLDYGRDFLEALLENIDPERQEFLVLTEAEPE